ncbi:hypothetical protein ACP4OV_027703 [Aristida adscensionis]
MEGRGNGVVIDPVRIGHEFEDDVCDLCGDGGFRCASYMKKQCCEGPCLRYFHATREDDDFSGCRTLGFTPEQVQAMGRFICTNCTNRQHRCAGCGVVGSSDAANAQVFRCSHVSCGRFYHPACIGAQLHSENPLEAARCRDQVAAGMVFECRRARRRQDDF